MATKMESLKDKLAKLNSQIAEEEKQEKIEAATAKVRDSFSDAIRQAITRVETKSGETLRSVGLGIWVAYPLGQDDATLNVSALAVGTDGLPRSLKKSTTNGRASNGNGNCNGNYEYVLADGRVFETCELAVNATGETTRDSDGNLLDGKKYWTRHDRLPKELADAITKREKPPAAEAPATEAPAAEAPATEAPAAEAPASK